MHGAWSDPPERPYTRAGPDVQYWYDANAAPSDRPFERRATGPTADSRAVPKHPGRIDVRGIAVRIRAISSLQLALRLVRLTARIRTGRLATDSRRVAAGTCLSLSSSRSHGRRTLATVRSPPVA